MSFVEWWAKYMELADLSRKTPREVASDAWICCAFEQANVGKQLVGAHGSLIDQLDGVD